MKGGCAALEESLPLALQPVKAAGIKQAIVASRKMLFESSTI
jgi:hypothetical protein